jgi:4-hydroxybutyrate CoA-transferase
MTVWFDSAAAAVKEIASGARVFVHGVAAVPTALVAALVERSGELRDVELVHLHTEGDAPYARPEHAGHFRVRALFVAANVREAVHEGRGDYVPIFLSEIPDLFTSGTLPLDVALLQVSPPDQHGYCSLGTSVDVARAAQIAAKKVIAQVNRHHPRTHGDGLIHISEIDVAFAADVPLPEHAPRALDDVDHAIGRRVAELVEDGSTLQVGIGSVPDAVLAALVDHRDLGVHSEMFSDGVVDLALRGVITNTRKKVHPGKIIATFVMGTRKTYDFVNDNPAVSLLDAAYVNDPNVIRRNPRVVAINSAIEIDLTGQVCADSIGTYQYSGVGGQMDFMRGAARSEGGKPIIALSSTTRQGAPRIVPVLKEGAGVVTTRAHVRWVVTEHGAVNLHGRSLRERAIALVGLAAPQHRDALMQALAARFPQ